MKASATVLEPRLAWVLWQGLMKLSDLLWECYEEEFLKIDGGVGDSVDPLETRPERADRTRDSEEDLEIPF